jgi:D-3-phosphoglycerate dehydrogenase / 2-oxoglutarate reductase
MNNEQPRVAVIDTGYGSYDYEERLLTEHGYRFDVWTGAPADIEGKRRFAKGARGLFIRWTKIDDAFLEGMTGLDAIVRYGVGYENVDVDAATRAGVIVSNVQGYGNHAVSDHAVALMYACSRGLLTGNRTIRDSFGGPPLTRIFEFHEKTIGIIGLGRIGGTLAGKVKHLFGRVIACDPYIAKERFASLGVEAVDLDGLLRKSDVLSIHCNHTAETEGLLDAPAFARMERCPIVVNTARGPIIDETALYDALESDRIHSAGIDVFRTELKEELPARIIDHPRVVATGHYAWYSERSHVELQRRAADNLLAMLEGSIPDDCLNPAVRS